MTTPLRTFLLPLTCLVLLLVLAPLSARADCPTGCDDGNPCTDDICDAQASSCVHSFNTLPCTDGVACTTGDACNMGVCVGGDTDLTLGCAACDAVAILPAEGAVVRGTTAGNSSLSGSCGATSSAPERVFAWTPDSSGLATFSTCSLGTNFDTAVYVRKDLCAGAEQTCSDDASCSIAPGTSSTATLNVTAGETYYVVVDGASGAQGKFELSVSAPAVCGNDVREGAESCDGSDSGDCFTGQCQTDCTCVPPTAGLPDLSVSITDYYFEFGASVSYGDYSEGCAEAQTGVDLLRLGVKTINVGPEDLVVGPPGCPAPCTDHPLEVCGNTNFICSPAEGHNHGHYTDYARYELLDTNDQTVVVGHKQGFCLLDHPPAGPCPNAKFTCENQGLTAGCADLYSSNLGCQYLDITGVPPGDYKLRAWVDPFDRIPELTNANNIVTLDVTIPPNACNSATVIPPGGGTFTGTTSGASQFGGICDGSSTSVSPELIFSWTPDASGTATVDTCDITDTGFDTVLFVRSPTCAGGGGALACNDDDTGCNTAVGERGSRTSFQVTAGQTYFLVVDGYGGDSGNFRLNVAGPTPPPACANGLDDDADGAIDYPNDPGCTRLADPFEQPDCADTIDNDGDGDVDFPADAGCGSPTDPSELPPCADGIDNDGDGLVDFPSDPGCLMAMAPYSIENPECNDGIDNDGDTLIDFPADPECELASGFQEAPPPSACGLLGIEALIPAAVGLALRRRRKSRRTW